MACGSACCAPPKATSVVMRTLTLPVLNTDAGSSVILCEEEKSCRPELSAIADKCHTGTATGSSKKDDCCSSKPTNVESQDLDPPSCCEGKESPCCNYSCIDRLALRACAAQGQSPSSYALQSDPDSCIIQSTRQAVHLQIAPAEMAERRVNDMLAAPGINISPNWKRLAAFVVHYSL
jgi:hypothetical protein